MILTHGVHFTYVCYQLKLISIRTYKSIYMVMLDWENRKR